MVFYVGIAKKKKQINMRLVLINIDLMQLEPFGIPFRKIHFQVSPSLVQLGNNKKKSQNAYYKSDELKSHVEC